MNDDRILNTKGVSVILDFEGPRVCAADLPPEVRIVFFRRTHR
jgi:hypothetical protein